MYARIARDHDELYSLTRTARYAILIVQLRIVAAVAVAAATTRVRVVSMCAKCSQGVCMRGI